jgi:hypothetical protein
LFFSELLSALGGVAGMIAMSVKTNFPEVRRALGRLPAQIRDQVTVAALNKTGDKGRTEMTRSIAAEYAIKSSEVRPQLVVTRANRSRVAVSIEAFGVRRGKRSRNVMVFGARQTREGVTVKIRKDGPRKLIKGAFIGNKGRTVFIRDPYPLTKRLPIKGVETIDVPQMFNTRRINRRVVERMVREFPVEFDRAAVFVLSRFNRA